MLGFRVRGFRVRGFRVRLVLGFRFRVSASDPDPNPDPNPNPNPNPDPNPNRTLGSRNVVCQWPKGDWLCVHVCGKLQKRQRHDIFCRQLAFSSLR